MDVVAGLGDLSGKLVLDVTNNIKSENGYTVPQDGPSTAQRIQMLAPNAKVVKGLNTLNIAVMANTKLGGDHVTLPIAGNDKEAKAKVASIIQAMGLEAVGVGPIVAARYIEEMERMSIGSRAYSGGMDIDYAIHVRGTPRAK